MNYQGDRGTTMQATLFSLIFSLFIFIVCLIVIFITDAKETITLGSVLRTIRTYPLLWIISFLTVAIPVAVFIIYRKFGSLLAEKQEIIDQENAKVSETANFISRLTQEDFGSELKMADKEDKLANSLMELRDTLKQNKEASEKRRKEDEIRNWTAEGLAKFGEILRRDNDNLDNLAYNVVKNLTDYIDAIQGGFYLLRDEDKEKKFNLIAFYAYGRKKYADKVIKWGKGIIGTSAIENKTIYLTELPDSYVTVTSGLGKANPRSLIVTPIFANDELFGVLEIASLNEIGKHQISFVEKVAESTASILSTVKMNMQTSKLLEESKAQAQTLTSQEEEMRQNMEELQATQEEAARQADRFLKLETTVNHTMLRAEYGSDGTLLYANTKFLNKLEYTSNSDVEGKHISMFISKKDEEWFKRIWTGLAEGGRHFEGYMKHVTRTEKDLWTMATYTCIRNEEGGVERILFLGLDTTEQKKLSLNLEGVVDAVDRSSIKIEFDINGNIKEYNESFIYLFKYSEKEIKKLSIFDLVDTLELELFNKKWENIVRGMNFQGQFKVNTKSKDEKWIRGAFSAVYNMYGEVEKVIYIGNDTTNEKLMEIESKQQHETLKKQEKLLRESEKELSRKLKEVKLEMKNQFYEVEKAKSRYELTLENSADAVIISSHDNKIVSFNKAAEELLDYDKQEVIGKSIGIFFTDKAIDENNFIAKYTGPGDNKITGKREKIRIKNKSGNEIDVFILLSKATVEKENSYTAFIQRAGK
jgi:PAS domain S-box-containing protein